MPPSPPRLRILSVGGNAVSAFLSWRLQATNACDVTLVWKANHQAVAQYGVTFQSKLFGNERFKPKAVVQTPEDAASNSAAFDYVLLCVKALPDVYNLADIIQSVITPQHTCILVNTTNTLGVEKQLEERFPTNVVLSLVSSADITQLGASEFEHTGSTEIWVGPANVNPAIPEAIQKDMSEALAMTLTTARVDCKVSLNIRQQQYERMIGPIAFHTTSVLFEAPILSELVLKPGVRELIVEVMQEMVQLASAQRCIFASDFIEATIRKMLVPSKEPSTMYQDYLARRPMEVETYLGSPVELAHAANVRVPRIETLYTLLRHLNTINKDRPPPQSPTTTVVQPPPRGASTQPPPRLVNGGMNGNHGPGRSVPAAPAGRRGPPPVNGFRGPPPPANSYPPRGPPRQRRPSFEENNLEEFSHVMLYDEVTEPADTVANYGNGGAVANGPSLRERELMLREKEIQLKQQELAMRSRGPRRPSHNHAVDMDDDDDDDDYFDPMNPRPPPGPPIDPDSIDMMSVTSRRTKRTTSQGQLRKDQFGGSSGMRSSLGRPFMGGRHRTSAQLVSHMPIAGDNILDNPMMGFSSNRYGFVDRKEMQDESRANSLTPSRLAQQGPAPNGGAYPGVPSRRTSRSPGNPLNTMGRGNNRPSPPNEPYMQHGPPRNDGMMQAPVPRYPPGQGNMVRPHQVEQQVGVSKPYPPKIPTKSLTGSASASAGSGDSGSANLESEPSAHSSTSSFAPRMMMGIR